MSIQQTCNGSGKPLLLVHGLGSSRAAWSLVVPALARHREVIAIDLPGHGTSAAEHDSGTFAGLARSLSDLLVEQRLVGIDMVGVSMGARLVLEMARCGQSGAVIALVPGGFWHGWERSFVKVTLTASGVLLRSLGSALPKLARNAAGRTMLLAQLAARPWALNGELIANELLSICETAASRTWCAILRPGLRNQVQQPLVRGRLRLAGMPTKGGKQKILDLE